MHFLISIKPQYAQMILEGRKTVELRRTNVKAQIGDVFVVYATTPVKKVVAIFSVKELHYAPIDIVWKRYGINSCLSYLDFKVYSHNKEDMCAIIIENVTAVDGLCLRDIREKAAIHIPQSYMSITESLFCSLCRLKPNI